jgi:hypothetical protein
VGCAAFGVVFDVRLGGFRGVMGCVLVVTIGKVRVMRCGLVLTGFVVASGLSMVTGRVLVMLCRFVVMFGCLFGPVFPPASRDIGEPANL